MSAATCTALCCCLLLSAATTTTTTEYWEKAEFPFELVPKLKALKAGGGTIKGYGCAVSHRDR